MGRVGDFYYPDIKLREALEAVGVIDRVFNGKVNSSDPEFARRLGHDTVKSGGFRWKITALRRYGLIKGTGTITISDFGQKLIHPENELEYRDALEKVLSDIAILSVIHDAMGRNEVRAIQLTLEELIKLLNEKTKEKLSKINKEAPKIRHIYLEIIDQLLDLPNPPVEPEKFWDQETFDRFFELLNDPILSDTAVGVILRQVSEYGPPSKEPINRLFKTIERSWHWKLGLGYAKLLHKALEQGLVGKDDVVSFKDLFTEQVKADPKRLDSNEGIETYRILFDLLFRIGSELAYTFLWQGFELMSGSSSWGYISNLFGTLIEKDKEYRTKLREDVLMKAKQTESKEKRDRYLYLLSNPLRLM